MQGFSLGNFLYLDSEYPLAVCIYLQCVTHLRNEKPCFAVQSFQYPQQQRLVRCLAQDASSQRHIDAQELSQLLHHQKNQSLAEDRTAHVLCNQPVYPLVGQLFRREDHRILPC